MMQSMDPQEIKQRVLQEWAMAAPGWRKHDTRLRETSEPVTLRMLELAAIAPGQRVSASRDTSLAPISPPTCWRSLARRRRRVV